jgi:hypothetical protein
MRREEGSLGAFRTNPGRKTLPSQTDHPLEATVGHWLSLESLALYAVVAAGTWFRQLAHVELPARDGRQWDQAVRAASGRQSQNARFRHMRSTDTGNPLAYPAAGHLSAALS